MSMLPLPRNHSSLQFVFEVCIRNLSSSLSALLLFSANCSKPNAAKMNKIFAFGLVCLLAMSAVPSSEAFWGAWPYGLAGAYGYGGLGLPYAGLGYAGLPYAGLGLGYGLRPWLNKKASSDSNYKQEAVVGVAEAHGAN